MTRIPAAVVGGVVVISLSATSRLGRPALLTHSGSGEGTEEQSAPVGSRSFAPLGFLGPNIDLTIEGNGVFAFGGAVPKPSTWAMLLLGFPGLAYAGYRRGERPASRNRYWPTIALGGLRHGPKKPLREECLSPG